MPAERTHTDDQLSSSSTEFVWDVTGHAESHTYLAGPVLSLLRAQSVRTVLDLGCGNGSLSNEIAQQGYSVTGVDHSGSGIALAQRTYQNLRFRQHDVSAPLTADYAQCYDAVVSTEVIEHLLLPRGLLDNAMYALRPGGVLVLSAPYHGYLKNLLLALTNSYDRHWHPLRDYGHVKFFSKATIMQLVVERGFRQLTFVTAGRMRWLAKSMIVSGVKPS